MTAQEMFEAIGFVPFFETPVLFVYENFPKRDIDTINIAFYKYSKKFLVYYINRDDPVEIDSNYYITLLFLNSTCFNQYWRRWKMNIYQEDLGRIARLKLENGKVAEDFLPQTFKELQELVDKATLKKPLIAFADSVTADGSIVQKTALVCPSCKSFLVERQKYCPNCGQALDWRVEDGEA